MRPISVAALLMALMACASSTSSPSSSTSSGSTTSSSGSTSSGSTSGSTTSSGGPNVQASSFDQSCAADTDCVAVWEGTGPSCCGCPTGAINKNDLTAYQQATKGWPSRDCRGLGCAGCEIPAPVACNAGKCTSCQGSCPPKDAGADG